MLITVNLAHEKIETQLSSGERILWSGQLRQGVVVRGSDTLMIPFTLLRGGFDVFWEILVINSEAPIIFTLWEIPSFFGVYLIIDRFFVDAKQRANTFYAVTNERALIMSWVFTNKVKSPNLPTLPDLSLEDKGTEGTIFFGGIFPFASILRTYP